MRTYLFSDEDVRRYARDLTLRLDGLGDKFPSVWFTLGESGDKIAEVIYPLIEPAARRDTILIEPIYFDRTERSISLRDGTNLADYSKYHTVLLLDGAVHSGASMQAAVNKIISHGVHDVISYSFVVKRTSSYIPNYFGVIVGEHDRPYFQLEIIPNNVLQEKPPFGVLRRICADDVGREQRCLTTGVPSIDRTHFGDLWFSDQTEGSYVFVYQCGDQIAAYISFRVAPDNSVLFIDLLAADVSFHGQGFGGLLMRWAGTFARSCCCTAVELRAHKDRVAFYEHFGFTKTGDTINIGDGEIYTLMRKRIIYTGNPVHLMSLRDRN